MNAYNCQNYYRIISIYISYVKLNDVPFLQTLVLISQYTMGRNPESFRDPEKFMPERWERPPRTPGAHRNNLANGCMPFGGRVRSCIGKRVAEMKMRVLIARVSKLIA